MMYYVTKTTIEESQNTKSIWEFPNKNEAITKYHDEMGAAMKYPTVISCTILVYDEYRNIFVADRYDRDQPAPPVPPVDPAA